MKLTLSIIATAAICLLKAKTLARSDVFGWDYELDPSAPAIDTQAEILATAAAHNQTVTVERVGGTMMLVDLLGRRQVAKFGSQLDAWARANYPSDDLVLRGSAEVDAMKAELHGLLDEVRAGHELTRESILARRVAERGLEAAMKPAAVQERGVEERAHNHSQEHNARIPEAIVRSSCITDSEYS
ncbi:hypothetical protein B0T18DRAFT_389318 [Schizothecium vesticola]|uniref:Uncharacterized protein n=1 Tax=Schizothecium vesticola TaxID=314040 RepID=A0AA40F2B6_9PEZI|nr:hypothetical protein B0T18DRAFT_389318 [Schizothecium vesticola]